MSKVNFFALGGVQETGKNLYILEIDEKIFILDCGLRNPTSELYGVDVIINDYTYIDNNIDRVCGLFVTNCYDEHMGGISHLLRKHYIKVFGTKFTLAVLKDSLKENEVIAQDDQLIEISSKTLLHFGDTEIKFFEASHNIPECLGIAFKTTEGYFIYTSRFNFDQNSHIDFSHMFKKLTNFSKEGVVGLFMDSLGTNDDSSRGTILELKLRLQNIFARSQGRIICPIFSSDVLRIQQICNIAAQYGKKVAILGRKTQKIVNEAINLGFLTAPSGFANLKYIDEKNKNNDKDLVIIVTGQRHEPYFMLQRMARGVDRLIHLEKTDDVVVLTNPTLGTEKMAARTLDIIYHVTSNVYQFSSSLLVDADANREEIKEMINILKPKYIVPVIGEYRHQYGMIAIAECVGYKTEDVIICDNGDVLTFDNGKYQGITADVPCGEVLIDGKAFKDVSDVVMRDRELLADDGVVILAANINPRTKTVIVGPEVVTKGFTCVGVEQDFTDKLKEIFYKVSSNYLTSKFINWSELKNSLKAEISHYIYKSMKKSPIIIPVLISTDMDLIKRKGLEDATFDEIKLDLKND